MTAAEATPIVCPSCGSTYVTDLADGTRFCAACRNEWDPKAPPAPPAPAVEPEQPGMLIVDPADSTLHLAGRQAGEPLTVEQDLIDRVDELGSYDTIVMVTHDDGGSGNVRTDRYTYHTTTPHTQEDAALAARTHFEQDIGSNVLLIERGAEVPVTTLVRGDESVHQVAAAMEARDADADANAEAYLASLVGTGVTLEGGQRATILSFEDGDFIIVQFASGDTATVDFNDVIHADNGPPAGQIVDVELDDETAEAFGAAALMMACLVIEAGVASVEGEGDEAHLIEPPTDWFIADVDAIPLMEQASAAAVALLIQTFALPRDVIATTLEAVRVGIQPALETEGTGNDTNTSNDEE